MRDWSLDRVRGSPRPPPRPLYASVSIANGLGVGHSFGADHVSYFSAEISTMGGRYAPIPPVSPPQRAPREEWVAERLGRRLDLGIQLLSPGPGNGPGPFQTPSVSDLNRPTTVTCVTARATCKSDEIASGGAAWRSSDALTRWRRPRRVGGPAQTAGGSEQKHRNRRCPVTARRLRAPTAAFATGK